MNNLEFNKVFASLLIAGIIAMLCGFIAKQIVHPEALEKNAVMIEAAVTGEGGAAKPAGPEPILAMLAKADVTKGQQVTKACLACHNLDNPGKNAVGPMLWNVVGRKKDSIEGFAYSGELEKNGGPVWTYEEMNKFLYKPKAYAPNTKMNFVGLKKAEDRAAAIAFLRSLNPNAPALPSEADIKKEEADLAPPAAATPAKDDKAATPAPATETKPEEAPAKK